MFDSIKTQELKRQTMLNTRLSIAYTNAGRGKEYFEEYVKKVVKQPDFATSVPLAGSTYILVRHPELLQECM